MRAVVALVAVLLCGIAPAAAGQTLESLSAQAKDAISRDAYESALQILTEATQRYPDSPKPHLALADLYYDKELFPLALSEYRAAEQKGADDFQTLTQVSRCYGKLNQEGKSIEYLTRILERYPESSETVDDLGWMYFKTHQLDKGEAVLLDGIARLGMRRGMAMTLGTVYSGMNRYEESRRYYLKSVEEALRAEDRNFASIAYYNLSLLERNFFHYNSALRFTDDSIAQEDRASGHLARGELLQARMEFAAAEQEYQQAYALDTTPLSRVNLADLLREFGRLDLARRYAEDVLASRDLTWMLYYGTDTNRHFKELHALLADIHDGLWRRELGRPTAGILDRISALFQAARSRVLAWYHRQRFRIYALSVGGEYLAQGSFEDAWWEFYRGNEAYPEVALKYLGMAREIETARSPHAEALYLVEEGTVRRSAALLEKALAGLDPFWEKEPAAEALLAQIPLLRGPANAQAKRKAIVRLYDLNPGALPQAGLGLPFAVEWIGAGWRAREKALVLKFLRRAGSECVEAPAGGGLECRLRVSRESDGSWRWKTEREGAVTGSGAVPAAGSPRQRSAALVRNLLEELYSVH
jgi:Tfp pilus assembly protein PilF